MASSTSPQQPAAREEGGSGTAARSEDLMVLARDGTPLAGTLYVPAVDRGLAVPLNPATAVPRRYDDAFALLFAGEPS
jgi:predicted acyl esterase